MAPFTHSQFVAMAILPKVGGFLSFLGSSFLVQDITRDPTKRRRTYGRLLVGISCFDVLASLMCILSTWPIPEDDPMAPLYASGTTATCTMQGFFIQANIAVPFYSFGLAIYYFLILVKSWPDWKIKKLEKYVHGVAIFFGLGTAVAGLFLKLYNNANLWCWISSLPQTCEGGNAGDKGKGECVRGQNSWIYRWAFMYAPLWFNILGITFVMSWMAWHVFITESKSQKWKLGGGRTQTKRGKSMSSRVCSQSVQYSLAFYSTFLFPTVIRVMQLLDKRAPAWIYVAASILTPLTGFWNVLIYIKPRFEKKPLKHTQASSSSLKNESSERRSNVISRLLPSFISRSRSATTQLDSNMQSDTQPDLRSGSPPQDNKEDAAGPSVNHWDPSMSLRASRVNEQAMLKQLQEEQKVPDDDAGLAVAEESTTFPDGSSSLHVNPIMLEPHSEEIPGSEMQVVEEEES